MMRQSARPERAVPVRHRRSSPTDEPRPARLPAVRVLVLAAALAAVAGCRPEDPAAYAPPAHDAAAQDAATQDAATQNAATRNAATRNAATRNAATRNAATQDSAAGSAAGHGVAGRCAAEAPGVWAAACRRGVVFRAVGQEPGWLLEIDGERRMLLTTDYGEQRIEAQLPVPGRRGRQLLYGAQTTAGMLRIAITEAECQDIMSGELFPAAVTVTLAARELEGCGRPLGTPDR
jgi:uncharacterized membrane protein